MPNRLAFTCVNCMTTVRHGQRVCRGCRERVRYGLHPWRAGLARVHGTLGGAWAYAEWAPRFTFAHLVVCAIMGGLTMWAVLEYVHADHVGVDLPR